MVEIRRRDGTVLRVPSSVDAQGQRRELFYQEFRNHPSVASSAVELLNYAHDTCGISTGINYLGLNGYQAGLPGSGADGLFNGGTDTNGSVSEPAQPVPTPLPPPTALLPPSTTVVAP